LQPIQTHAMDAQPARLGTFDAHAHGAERIPRGQTIQAIEKTAYLGRPLGQ